jgi:hypothetical protein
MKKIFAIFAIGTLVFSTQSCGQDETVLSEVMTNDARPNQNVVKDSLQFQKNMSMFSNNLKAFHINGDVGRYWKSSGNDFVYTNNSSELPPSLGFTYQMNLGRAYSSFQTNATLTRWNHPSSGDRLLTVNNEHPGGSGWVNEGQIATVSTTPIDSGNPLFNTHPVYRYRKYNGGRHLFTVDYNELGGGNSYWVYEGVFFHMYYN